MPATTRCSTRSATRSSTRAGSRWAAPRCSRCSTPSGGWKASRSRSCSRGRCRPARSSLLAERDLGPLVRSVGALEHTRALELQRAADTLLVVTEGAARPSVATGKLFEYLAAGPPILVLGEETEAARIVRETGAGSATSATDPERIAAALRAPPEAAPGEREEYSYAEIARRYSELVEEVVASRNGASAAATSPGA